MEYVVIVVATYLFCIMYGVARMMNAVLDDERGAGTRKYSIFLRLGGLFVAVIVLYFLPVRIGTVMFVNGVIVCLVVLELGRIFARWKPWQSWSAWWKDFSFSKKVIGIGDEGRDGRERRKAAAIRPGE